MSTAEIQLLDDELLELEEVIEKGIEDAKRVSSAKAQEKVTFLQDRIKRVKQAYRNFRVEVKDLEGVEKRKFVTKGKEHNEVINRLMKEFSWLKERGELIGEEGDSLVDPNQMTAGQLYADGVKTQQEDIKTLERVEHQVIETQEIGAATLQTLNEQTEELAKIDAELSTMEGFMKRADRELRAFVRRIATDKVFMLLILLMVLAIIGLIIIKIVDPDGKGKDLNLPG